MAYVWYGVRVVGWVGSVTSAVIVVVVVANPLDLLPQVHQANSAKAEKRHAPCDLKEMCPRANRCRAGIRGG